MRSIVRFSLVLLVVNMIASLVLAGVYTVTKSSIDQQKTLVEKNALKQVMPDTVGDRIVAIRDKDDSIKYWKVYRGNDDEIRGYIFTAKRYGYSSLIETMVGIKKDGTITGVSILSQNETPGLGAKMVETSSDKTLFQSIKNIFKHKDDTEEKPLPYFTEQFKGMDATRLSLDNSRIQAITGATISSKACVDSIRTKAMEIINER